MQFIFKIIILPVILLLLFLIISPNNVLAVCTGQQDGPSTCTLRTDCPLQQQWIKTVIKYDCAAGVSGCLIEDAVAQCSYPEYYDNSSCTGTVITDTCSTYCSVNATEPCTTTSTGACNCGSTGYCAGPTHTASQICSGYQQSTYGGCVSSEMCGYYCGLPNSPDCLSMGFGKGVGSTLAACLRSCVAPSIPVVPGVPASTTAPTATPRATTAPANIAPAPAPVAPVPVNTSCIPAQGNCGTYQGSFQCCGQELYCNCEGTDCNPTCGTALPVPVPVIPAEPVIPVTTPAPVPPWIQTTGGDVHSNTGINAP